MNPLRSLLLAVLVLTLFGAAFFWWVIWPWYILDNGIITAARIVETWHTSSTVNDAPLLGMRLEVTPVEGEPYEVRKYCRQTFDTVSILRTGTALQVRYDPRLPSRVAIVSLPCDSDTLGMLFIAFSTVGFIGLSFLATPFLLRRFVFNTDLLEGGEPAHATVLNASQTGTLINNNPLMRLELQIHSSLQPAMRIETKVVIPVTDAPFLQPGTDIEIRYDPDKPQRVAIVSLPNRGERQGLEPAERLEQLEELRTRRLVSEEEYNRLRGEILDSL